MLDMGGRGLIEEAIRLAEMGTSGEIRVHIDEVCPEDVLDHAAFVFSELEMHKTDLRNGVLIYISVEDQKLAIIGDAGIHKRVGSDFWDQTRQLMTRHLRDGRLIEALCEGVKQAGEKLKIHFPIQTNDRNELSNVVTTGKVNPQSSSDR
jgi:uncharacterized membrane protein